MDIAGLSKATGETIVLLLSVLGFMVSGSVLELPLNLDLAATLFGN